MDRSPARTLVLLVVLATATACGDGAERAPGSYEMSGPVYESVTELARDADAVFTGSIVEEHSREADNPPGDEEGVPVVLYEFAVDQVIVGDVEETTYLLWWDISKAPTDDISDISDAGELLVFAESWTDSPGIDTVAAGHSPLMFDNGVLDIDGDMARPRSPLLTSLRPGAEPSARSSEGWPLSKIIDLVRSLDG